MVLMRRMESLQDSAALADHLNPADIFAPAFPRLRSLNAESQYTGLARAAVARHVVLACLVIADFCGAATSLCFAYFVAHDISASSAGLTTMLPWIAGAAIAVMLHCISHGHNVRRTSAWQEMSLLVPATAVALMATWCAADLTQDHVARYPLLAGWVSFPLAILAARACAQQLLRQAGLWRIPVLIVGDGEDADAAECMLGTMAGLGYDVVARVALAELGQLLTANGWRGLLRVYGAQTIALAYDEAHPSRPSPRIIEALARERLPVCVMRRTHGLPSLACVQAFSVGHETIMLSHEAPCARPVSRLLKAALDMSVAATLLLLMSPLFVLLALLIRSDGGPAFFAHTRIGSRGRAFGCLKFRTMVCNSDALLRQHLAENELAAREWETTQKLRLDPRVTRIGRILRKTSLDELPQLINVLKLEMSLVGPRPIVRREVSRYADDIAYYYATRPGITGLWQVSGRNDTTYARRVELDRWYVKNWTIGQDFAILARTLPAVWSGRGAS